MIAFQEYANILGNALPYSLLYTLFFNFKDNSKGYTTNNFWEIKGEGGREQGATKILRGFCHWPYLKMKFKWNEMRFILRENNAHFILRSNRESSYEITASASVRSSSGTRKSRVFSVFLWPIFFLFFSTFGRMIRSANLLQEASHNRSLQIENKN